MATITMTIPDPSVQRVLDAIAGIYPIPQIPDPGDPLNTIDEFTKTQWAKEHLKRHIRKVVARYETQLAQINAVVAEDGTIVEVT